jgi:hypothetical protein
MTSAISCKNKELEHFQSPLYNKARETGKETEEEGKKQRKRREAGLQRRGGKAEEAGGIPGRRGSTRRRRRQQAGEQLPTADGGADSRQSRCGRSMAVAATCDDAGAAPRQVRTCGDARLRGRGGRPVDSSRRAAKPQAELEVRPPPSLFLSPRPHSW